MQLVFVYAVRAKKRYWSRFVREGSTMWGHSTRSKGVLAENGSDVR